MVRPRARLSRSLLPLSLLLVSTPSLGADAGSASTAAPFVLPPVHYNAALSFRGVSAGGAIPSFDVSGHSCVPLCRLVELRLTPRERRTGLPGVHDYLRLVPPTPLAHGALFSTATMEAEEWIAEIAFRVHGPPAVGLVDISEEDGVPARSIKVHKGGRGLAFWVTKVRCLEVLIALNDGLNPKRAERGSRSGHHLGRPRRAPRRAPTDAPAQPDGPDGPVRLALWVQDPVRRPRRHLRHRADEPRLRAVRRA